MEKITQKFNLDYSNTIANIRKRKKKSIKCFMHIPTKEFHTHEDFVDRWIGNIVCFDFLNFLHYKKIFSIVSKTKHIEFDSCFCSHFLCLFIVIFHSDSLCPSPNVKWTITFTSVTRGEKVQFQVVQVIQISSILELLNSTNFIFEF